MSGRLAVVTHYWAPHVGGIETVAREQSRRLGELGWPVGVFTTRLGTDAATEADGALAVRRYRCLNWPEQRLRLPVPAPSLRMAADLVSYARTADVVVAHGHCYPTSVLAARAARITGRPLVVIQHNPFVDYPFPLDAVERGVDVTIGRRVLHQAETVVCVSRHVESYVRAIAPRARTEMIYSGVDTSRFRPGGPRPPGSPQTPPFRVLTVRRLVPRNGVDVLIEAWRRFQEQRAARPEAELIIAGSGPELPALRRLASGLESVTFTGHVPDDELPGLYRSAGVVVVPSVSGEGFGLVAAEALASGTPVIATTGGATGEVVRDGTDGLVVEAGNRDALARALARLAADPDRLARMTAAARERGPELGWDAAIRRLAGVLDAARGTVPEVISP
jgi:glycosyltransferase involved in cell wall biosynthesis